MELRSKQARTKCSITIQYINNNTASNLFTFITTFQRQRHYSSRAFIRLLTLRCKGQDRVGNDDLERIQSFLCEDTMPVKKIIVI